MSELKWHQQEYEQVFKLLETTSTGLSSAQAKERLVKYGYNELTLKKRSSLMRLLDQCRSPLVLILVAAATITSLLSLLHIEDLWMDTAVIVGVVVLNVILGFYQEGKAEGALEALKKMAVSSCTVIRDKTEKVIPTRELVPGDVVVLNGGDKVPADLRLFFTKDAHADEAPLTGESTPVTKSTVPFSSPDLPPADQKCMAFSGTFIVRGTAKGVVVRTAEKTEFGKIATLVRETQTIQTPLQKQIGAFTKTLIIGILGIALINAVIGISVGQGAIYLFMASVALIVAGIPEMLPMIVTGVLSLAATQMAKKHALIRRLPATETLGCTTVICSDKTGTLTKNEMTVSKVFAGGVSYRVTGVGYEPKGQLLTDAGAEITSAGYSSELIETIKAGYLCNNASLMAEDLRYRIIGDPTEGALVVSAAKIGISERSPRLDELPFDSERMYMATMHDEGDRNVIYVKGSPEKIIGLCSSQVIDGKDAAIDKQSIIKVANSMAEDALRVLGMAFKVVPKDKTVLTDDDLKDLVFLGLQGMMDPPRPEAIEAVEKCKHAGIRTVMITGDHMRTAVAIARKLKIIDHKDDTALSGEQLCQMSDAQLYDVVKHVSVYARVAPEHKLRIAQQLQKRGEIVTMTGDGVNDAPALKAADIGVAMGITGTEVSKEVASIVLTDDNFASIVSAAEEGRHAWKNLEKAILYTLPTNFGQMALIVGSILLAPLLTLFALRLPLEPIQILWINLADSVFLTMPLLFEPKEKGLLNEPPRNPKTKIVNGVFLSRISLVAAAMAVTGFVIFWFFGDSATANDVLLLAQAQTAAFIAVQFVHLGYVITARSVYDSAFTLKPFSNKWLLAGIAGTVLTGLALVYVPAAQAIFKTASIPLEWWPVILLALLPGFLVIELEKLIRKRVTRMRRNKPGLSGVSSPKN
ncbi:MAG: HAD-IC family P-type ATPase [Candidatus Bathyarchaeota archaeon]|nr:HAD-IC family P-type ATPase [Candidatus Bathyarchaeota archaeon]